MPTQAPNQLFDNSDHENLNQTIEDESNENTPKSARYDETPEYNSGDEEWRDFDGDAYIKRAEKRVAALKSSENRADLVEKLGAQLWCVRQFSPDVARWIVSDLPAKSLWEHLGCDELKPLKHEALRGFQQAAGSLRREPVQKRIAAWLRKNPDELHFLLLRWALQTPKLTILQTVETQTIETQDDEGALENQLPFLLRTFGARAVAAALAFGGRTREFRRVAALFDDPQKLSDFVAQAPPENEILPLQSEEQSAQPWQQEIAQLRQSLEQMRVQLDATRGKLSEQNGAKAKVKTLEGEVAALQKRETNNAQQFARKLEQNERKWAAKYEERGKSEAREERRARSLQNKVEALELDNKRLKKQVHQSAQSREEERRKVVALEAKLAQANGETPDETAAKNAVAAPPIARETPVRAVEIARPTPLDEVFEWQSHGRRIRMTAREVRRLIDKNDEASVATVILELEALQELNPDLRRRFVTRLKQAGAYYARVLTHKTSRVLVDASNVARALNNRYNKGQIVNLKLMRQELQRLDCWPIVFIADASLPHNIDKPAELREMARAGEIVLTDKGVEADEVLALEARKTGAYVVTNDARFFYKVSPDYEPPRLSFRVLEGLVTVDEF